METKTAAIIPKKERSKGRRSPNYPAISLKRAVELAKKQYERDQTHKVPIKLAYDRWGYKGSGGDLCLAAMRAYGLIDVIGSGDGREIVVSDFGRRIILKAPDSDALLRKAALSPKVHREIWDKYAGELPQDDVLGHYLIFERDFNEKSVAAFIGQFRETISLANLNPGDILEAGETGGSDGDPSKPITLLGAQIKAFTPPPKPRTGMNQDTFTLDEGQVVLQWPAQMSAESYEDFDAWLKVMAKRIRRAVAKTAESEQNDIPA